MTRILIALLLFTATSQAETLGGGAFGLGPESTIADLAARPDDSIVACGILDSAAAIPKATQTHLLLRGDHDSGKRAFVAQFSANLDQLDWIAVFPGDALEPTRMALGKDGAIAIGGRHLGGLATLDVKQENWKKSKGALAKVAADGSRVLWVSPAGPNQGAVTGIAIDHKDRVFFTADSTVRQASNYILRKNGETGRNEEWEKTGWCVYLHPNQEALKAEGQYFAFYDKAKIETENGFGFDYDGPDGWGPTQFSTHGFRVGGEVLVLPDGDVIVSSCLQYDFRVNKRIAPKPPSPKPKSELYSLLDGDEKEKHELIEKPKEIKPKNPKPEPVGNIRKGKSFPAFDYFLARYSGEGELRWSTNLYQPGDGVHTPDQKPLDLAYDAKNDAIYVLVHQHGSNKYRFKGNLVGDTGNLMISWLGRVRAEDGALENGWYFQNNRHGKFETGGVPKSPPYPQLAGNALRRVRSTEGGEVIVAGSAGAKMWTTENALQTWPPDQGGGGEGALLRLSPDLNSVQYASCLFADLETSFAVKGLAVTSKGIVIAGSGVFGGELAGEFTKADWAAEGVAKGCLLIGLLEEE
ncbi:MAG: hypothetical protein AAF585_13230 [Verrucomicrobiota bacterium]